MSVLDNLDDFLTNIADAIRAKKGTTDSIDAQNFAFEIQNLTVGPSEPTTPAFDANTVIDNNLMSKYSWIFDLDTILNGDGIDYASKFGVLCDDQYNAYLAGWDINGTYNINGDTITFIFNESQSTTWDFIVTYNRNTYTFDVNYSLGNDMSGTCIMRPINSDDKVDNNFYKTTFKLDFLGSYVLYLNFNKNGKTCILSAEGSTETSVLDITLIDGPFIYAIFEGDLAIIFYDSGLPGVLLMGMPFAASDASSSSYEPMLKALVECNQILNLSTAYTETATKIGDYAFYYKPIYQATISKNITQIGEYAFADTYLQSITFEVDSELKSIGPYAFHNCSYLENGAADFTNCTKLEEFNGFGSMYLNNSQMVNILNKVPATIKRIGDYAFSDSSSLTQVDLSKFTELEYLSGFDGCSNLLFSNIVMATSKLKTIGYRAFYKSSYSSTTENFPVLPNTITKIDKYAFGNRSFVTVDLSNLVNLEYLSGFYGCKGITSIILPTTSKITTIGEYAFQNCTSLKDFILPNTLTEISGSAFSGSGLTEINIPDSVKTIDSAIAYNCKSLTKVTFSSNLTTTGQNACNGCTALTNVILKEGITTIDGYAFHKCSSLTDITVPNSVTDINWYAFSECSKLANITLSNNLESIDRYAFTKCVELSEITIPSTLTYIGASAFSGCSKLNTMTILATKPPKLAASNSIPSTISTIYIPAGTASAYKAASNWSSYSSKFVELS